MWRARSAADNLHLGEPHAAEASAERLHRGLLGGKASGKARHQISPRGQERPLCIGEDALREIGSPSQELAETLDVDRVDTHPDHPPAPLQPPAPFQPTSPTQPLELFTRQ